MDKPQSTELLFEISHPGRRCHRLPECDVPAAAVEKLLPPHALAKSAPPLPEVGEMDLVRELKVPTRIAFLQASSYRGETTTPGELAIHVGVAPDVRGRDVLLLDDILDSGQTLHDVIELVQHLEPRSLRVGVLLRKRARQKIPLEPDYCGFEIPDAFVIGYGLDYNDEYRNLPYIAVLPGEK